MLPVYKTICVEVLAAVNEVELQVLREMLQKLVKNLENTIGDRNNPVFAEFMKFLMVTHLLLLKTEAQRNKLDRVSAKLCTSLLRYCKEIRSDKAFYDAGEANRKFKQYDMAYIFFNRYIDLYDAIEDPDNNGISDNTNFDETDIPSPYDIALFACTGGECLSNVAIHIDFQNPVTNSVTFLGGKHVLFWKCNIIG